MTAKRILVPIILLLVYVFFIKVRFKVVEAHKPSQDDIQNGENIIGFRKMDGGLKDFYDRGDLLCQREREEYENLIKINNNYVQRYVSLFLIASNLINHSVKDPAEIIYADFEIKITGEDLAFLQNISLNSKSISKSNYISKLSKLDFILGKVARQKEKTILEQTLESSKSFLQSIDFLKFFNCPEFHLVVPFVSLILIIIVMHYFYKSISLYLLIGIIVNGLMFWDSYTSCNKKIRDIKIENYVNMLRFKDVPKECDPANQPWYHFISNYIYGDKCLQYFKEVHRNAVEEVFLSQCIIDTYSHYFVVTPFRVLGSSVKYFSSQVAGDLPFPFNYITYFGIALFLIVIITISGLLICGKNLKLSSFGSSLEIKDNKPSLPNSEKNAILGHQSFRKPDNRVRKKLKPWTKSGPSKELLPVVPQRKKLQLRSSRDPEIFAYETD